MTSLGLAADQAAQQKMDKYSKLLSTHIFCPVAVETAGTWNGLAIELVQEIGRRITAITEDARETVSVPALVHGPSTGECGRLPKHNVHRMSRRCNR